ncbi:holin [Sporichthya sp.]|uniref:holin n=1 Tax=Sporichthya sp. TaxID=65475 RepID=UPI0017D6E05C|nr:holin [Sporichthya sp.]MBA3745248.1 hypothetical protein [Sporichthya sp.]
MTKGFIIDAAERIAWTAIQTFVGALLASPVFDSLGIGWQDALKVAGFAALASALKGLLALNIGSDNTAQLGADTYTNVEPVA